MAGKVHASQTSSSHSGPKGNPETTCCRGGEVTSLEVSSFWGLIRIPVTNAKHYIVLIRGPLRCSG